MAGNKGTTFINDLLKLIFNGTAIANVCDNAASSPLTNLYVALHTADPTSGNAQTSNETSYTSYARVAVARSGSGFTVSGASVVPVASISFPACTGGSATITHFSIGTASSGTGKLLYVGPVSPNIVVSSGVTPQLTTSTTVTEA